MIFKDANVHTVLVLEREDDVVGSLSDDFSIYTWMEALHEHEDVIEGNLICRHNEDHPFSIYYTR